MSVSPLSSLTPSNLPSAEPPAQIKVTQDTPNPNTAQPGSRREDGDRNLAVVPQNTTTAEDQPGMYNSLYGDDTYNPMVYTSSSPTQPSMGGNGVTRLNSRYN